MARGKETCKILKEIRRQIAEANGIELVTSECRYKGDCLGTCPKCEAEVRYLEQELRARSHAGKAVAIAGISAASLAMFMPMTTGAQALQETQNSLEDSVTVVADTIIVRGVVREGIISEDGSKEPLIGAHVENIRSKSVVSTDREGNFEIPACIGDSLRISYIGFIAQTIAVTEDMGNIEVSLPESENVLIGEVVVGGVYAVVREVNHYLDLNVTDENGNVIDKYDLDIERVWIDEDGDEDSEYIYPERFDDKHPCRIFWDYELKDEDGKPLKEATLRIEADGYEDPVIIKVKYPKRNARKNIKFKHRKK